MPKLQGLIFDLDGTLVDSAPDLRQALNRTLAEQGRRGITLDETKSIVGDGMLTTLKRAFESTGAPIGDDQSYNYFQNFVGYYRGQKADSAQIYPRVVETLKYYQQRGVKLGLCTNKSEGSTLKLLDDLDLARLFTFVAGGDTFPMHKPHPDHVRGVISGIGLAAEGCVMVGDSTNDVQAAKGAGIPCLVVTHGYGMDIANLGADGLIGNFSELGKALQLLGYRDD